MFTKILRDGRTLAFREYGKKDGFPIIFQHGNMNSSLFAPAWLKTVEQAEAAGARILSVDRPGVGSSSIHPDRSYSSWAMDVDELAAHLSLEKYAVLGYSSGGPHALACAALNINNRVVCCGLLSSDAPYSYPGLNMTETIYGSAKVDLIYAMKKAQENEENMRVAYSGMKDAARKEIALQDLDAAIAQGLEGPASDAVLEAAANWGFDISAGSVSVLMWHGVNDVDVPIAAGRFLAEVIGSPRAQLIEIEGENHTLIRRIWQKVLCDIVAASVASPA
jgi:pimeloyl-ACP methyl ester carboxylesterase